MDIQDFKPYDINIYHHLSTIIDKHKGIDYSDCNNDSFDALSKLIKLRHDIVCKFMECIITDTIMKPRASNLEYNLKAIMNYNHQMYNMLFASLGDIDREKIVSLTPDIIVYRDKASYGCAWKLLRDAGLGKGLLQSELSVLQWLSDKDIRIMEISVSSNSMQQKRQKEELYTGLNSAINAVSNSSSLFIFNLSVSTTNLNNLLQDVANSFDLKFDIQNTYMSIYTLLDSLESTLQQVKQQIGDAKAIDFFMTRQFGDNEGLSYQEYQMKFASKNRDIINEMYEHHMAFDNNGIKSKIDEMGDEMTTMTDDNVAAILKDVLEDSDTDQLFELKSNSTIIGSELEQIDKFIVENNTDNIKPSLHIFTPMTDTTICCSTVLDQSVISKCKLEQVQIITLMGLFSKIKNSGDNFITGLSDTLEKLQESLVGEFRDYNLTMFNDDMILNHEVDSLISDSYNKYTVSSRQKKQGTDSKISYLHNITRGNLKPEDFPSGLQEKIRNKIPPEESSRSFKQKMMRAEISSYTLMAKEFLKKNKSGTKKIREHKVYKNLSIDYQHYKDMDNYLDYLSDKSNTPSSFIDKEGGDIKFDEFIRRTMETFSKTDADIVNQFKLENNKSYMTIYDKIREYPAYWFSLKQFLVSEQLCHYTQYTLPTNTFSLFTAGSQNTCILVQNSYHDSGKDVGKAFLSFGYTDREQEINSLYGKIHTLKRQINGKEFIFFCTNWRRLTSTKATFMRDQFFSTLATSITSLLRSSNDLLLDNLMPGPNGTLRHHYTLRTIVGHSTNQRTAELLADMRYAIMSSFSEFSRIDKFISDKFQPPFRSTIDIWIYTRLRNVETFVSNIDTHRNNMSFKQPKFVNGKRTEESLGGQVMLPSIWDNYIITELQDILDDLFLYVHTIKEPSSIHSENVKSINTILKFQEMYNNMSDSRKKGDILGDKTTCIKFLTDKTIVGHCRDVTSLSSKHTLKDVGNDLLDDFLTEVLNEPLSNITSTKASIPEYERKSVIQKVSKKKIQMVRQRLEEMSSLSGEKIDTDATIRSLLISDSDIRHRKKNHKSGQKSRNPLDNTGSPIEANAQSQSEIQVEMLGEYADIVTLRTLSKQISVIPSDSHLPGGIRAKVHDCLLDFISRNPEANTVLDLARWNVVNNNSLVHADICIKAQYGAKREFYVINIGAKAQARLLEEYFHKICNLLPNEMISVPGDRKLLNMQSMINDVMSKKRSTHSIYFTNGDCTKWSAAETMECFHSLIIGMKDKIPLEAFKLLKLVIRSWGMKKVNIPVSILTNTYKIEEDITGYLHNCTDAQLQSTQNFLQGMFNYMSSFKAVCCSNYTMHIWKKMYPESDLEMQHLEHSDDYVLMISVRSEEEMLKFRKFHRMMMKLHGFNDSEKKTNTQKFLMEFISLASMNGHMTYPQIKKVKEVGLNLGCTGYRDDVDMAVSRVGEAIRIGTPGDASYAMQKIHLASVFRSYSLFPGQRNNLWDYDTMMEMPVEIFGMPDTHPILSTFTKGNVNNLRLYRYGVAEQSNIIEKLFSMEIINSEKISALDEADIGENLRLYHPRYTFNKEGKVVKKIRDKINLNFDEAKKFWDEHKSYNFIKPVCTKYLSTWMKAMYYRSNFTLAYSRNSRAQITLRLSTYTSKMCIVNTLDDSMAEEITPDMSSNRNAYIRYNPVTIQFYIEWLKQTNASDFKRQCEAILGENRSLSFEVMLQRTLTNCDSTIDAIYEMLDNSRLIRSDKEKLPTMAMLTPNRLLWVSTTNSPTTLLQYIFNPEDLKSDMRGVKSHKSLELDKESICKHYKVELSKSSPLSTVKTVFQDIIMSQQRRNLCMSYLNVGNNLDDFLKKHVEFGLSTLLNYEVHTRGITKVKNPHTGELYFKKNIDIIKEEVRLMIDDVTLAYVLMKHCYEITMDEITSVIRSMRFMVGAVRDEISDKTFDDMMEYDIVQLKSIGCKNSEIQRFVYIKSIISGDMKDLYRYIDTSFSYKYEYVKSFNDKSGTIVDQVKFVYLNCTYAGLKDREGNVFLIADSGFRVGIGSAYIIALKLFNRIKVSDLEYYITNPTKTNIDRIRRKASQNTEDGYKVICDGVKTLSNIYITSKGVEILSPESTDNDDYQTIYGFPFLMIGEIPESVNKMKEQGITKRAELIEDRSEVRTGTSKIFSLPYLDCTQSNLSYFEYDKVLNGVRINWWMSMSRIRTYVQQGDVDISRNDIHQFGLGMPEPSDSHMEIEKCQADRLSRGLPDLIEKKTGMGLLHLTTPVETEKIKCTAKQVPLGNVDIQTHNSTLTDDNIIEFVNSNKEIWCNMLRCKRAPIKESSMSINSSNILENGLCEIFEQIVQRYNLVIDEGDKMKTVSPTYQGQSAAKRISEAIGDDHLTMNKIINFLIEQMARDPNINKENDNWVDDAYRIGEEMYNNIDITESVEYIIAKGFNRAIVKVTPEPEDYDIKDSIINIRKTPLWGDERNRTIIKSFRNSITELILSQQTGFLLTHEDELAALFNKFEGIATLKDLSAILKNGMPVVSDQEDIVNREELPDGMVIKDYMMDNNLSIVAPHDLMVKIQELITSMVENGDCGAEDRQQMTMNFYEGRHPMSIGTGVRLVLIRNGLVERLMPSDLICDNRLMSAISNVSDDLIVYTAEQYNEEIDSIELYQSDHIHHGPTLPSVTAARDYNTTIDNVRDMENYMKLKEKLTLFGINWNDYSEELVSQYRETDEKDVPNFYTTLIRSLYEEIPGLTRFRYNVVRDFIVRELSKNETEIMSAQLKIFEAEADRTIGVMINEGIISVEMNISIKTNIGITQICTLADVIQILSFDSLGFKESIEKFAIARHEEKHRRGYFKDKEDFLTWLSTNKSYQLEWEDVEGLSRNDIESMKLKSQMPEGTFKLMPLDEETDLENALRDLEVTALVKEDERGESSSSDLMERQLTYHELAMMEPSIQRRTVIINSQLPQNIAELRSKGNPTSYIVKKYMAPYATLKNISALARLSLVQKMKFILATSNPVAPQEMLMASLLIEKVSESFGIRDIVAIEEGIVIVPRIHGMRIFYKIENSFDMELKQHIIDNGGEVIGGSKISPSGQDMLSPLDNAEIESLMRHSDAISMKELTRPDIKSMISIFERVYGGSGGIANMLRRKFGLNYVPV